MVTPQETRQFAAECLRWLDETDNAGHRDLMIRVHPATAGEPLGVAARQGGASAVLDDRGRLQRDVSRQARVGRISFDHKPYANEAHVRAGVGS